MSTYNICFCRDIKYMGARAWVWSFIELAQKVIVNAIALSFGTDRSEQIF